MTPEVGFLAKLAEQNRDHSIFAPSSPSMWMVCAGSLIPNALAHDRSSYESAEGTVAHWLGDWWLKKGKRPSHMVGKTVQQDGFAIPVDDGMLAYVEQYVEWVQDTDGDQYFETRVDLSVLFPIPNQGGTADHFACAPGRLVITDLKYGKGIQVYAQDNEQALLYAYGVFLEWDWYYSFQTIEIRICQPRLDHFDVWTIDRATLLEFAERVKERALLAWDLEAPRTPGEKVCTWCSVKGDCAAYLLWLDNRCDGTFDNLDQEDAIERASDMLSTDPVIRFPTLTLEAKARIYKMRGAFDKWFNAIEADLFAACLEGDGEAIGLKIVDGRSTRSWINEDAAMQRMIEVGIPEDETETRKLMSPNQTEEWLHAKTKMPKKKAQKLLESHTMRSEGVRTLVSTSDKREALPIDGDVFEDLDNGDL